MNRGDLIALVLLLVIGSIACASKHPAAAVKPRAIDFQDVLCTRQGDGLATCSCSNPEQVIDAKDPAHVLIRCR